MMAYSEDHIALAAEYALGTLDAGERAQVETMMAVDTEFAAVVNAWEFRLGVLNQMVGSVEPRPIVWENIRTTLGHSLDPVPMELPEAPPPMAPVIAEPTAVVEPAPVPVADNSNVVAPGVITPNVTAPNVFAPNVTAPNVIDLSSRARRWRNVASFATAMAAALIAMLGLQIYQPDLLPDALRPKPRIRTVEVKTPAPPAQASLNSSLCCSRTAARPPSS